ncbi:threonine/serine dehydratase [Croceicoccus ponticola]|uniref:Threonine/serine dehydratase n=1 Tax=Croceicoccus ponticola TaxID=2217664 RepID=A0A437GUA7_9SPHN|nr:threonine/serine dehydratase [Croceicoccus ponticola]RVQ64990.1 threonine/serine dehydratase [Croceicoccus ponticola]
MTKQVALAITAEDVRSAAVTIRGIAVRTPLLEYRFLNERVGTRVLVKYEGVQIGGAFKFRGAYNRLARIAYADRAKGVVAWSSGNHAQGVAAAARILGIPATIVMPADAPAMKLANTYALGAEVIRYDRETESREAIAGALSKERGAVLVPSFDDPYIIAGQGTAGLEIMEQAIELGARIGQVLVCCGGGGLVAGIATAIRDAQPEVTVWSVEPTAFDDTARSLASGTREAVPASAKSICDALLCPRPGELTFPINKALLAGGLSVSDEEVREAMRYAFEVMKLVIEPGGAVALAALLSGKAKPVQGATVVVVSGANVDAELFAEAISSA